MLLISNNHINANNIDIFTEYRPKSIVAPIKSSHHCMNPSHPHNGLTDNICFACCIATNAVHCVLDKHCRR